MKLYELITEYKTDKDPRLSNLSTSIDPTKIPDYFKKYIRDYFENGRGVYRGIIGHKPLLKGNTEKTGPRRSRNTHNYYTLWMDNHPSWSAFPKRSKSFICTTSLEKAARYSTNIYLVIPSNPNAKFGICNNDDIWISFKQAIEDGFHNMNYWAYSLHELLEEYYHNYDFNVNDLQDNYQTFYKCLETLDKLRSRGYDFDNDFDDYFKYHNSIIKTLEIILDPRKNGFELLTFTDLLARNLDNNEVWTDQECYFFNVDELKAMKDLLRDDWL